MSYDLAVWEGDRPVDDGAGGVEFQRLCQLYLESENPVDPSPRIAAYARALLDRYPDIDTVAGEDSPWASAPLIEEASGPFMHFTIVWSRCEEVSGWAAQLACEHGLVCYDPQRDQLRPERERTWTFELTSAAGRPVRDPDPPALRRAVVKLARDTFWAVLTRADDWYVQVGFGPKAGTRPGWYALERRDGQPERHFRTVLTDVEEIAAAFVAFSSGDPALYTRFAWQPYDPATSD